MAVITNYATLKTAIADYLVRDDLTDYIPNFVQNIETKLYRKLNLRNEETALSATISSGSATVPSDFKALKFAYYDQSPAQILQWVDIEQVYRDFPNRASGSTPKLISREGGSFVFGPSSKDGTLKGIYYAKQAFLRDTDGSWYVQNAPDLLLYGALLEAQPFLGADERIPTWRALFMESLDTVKEEQDNAEASSGQLIQSPA